MIILLIEDKIHDWVHAGNTYELEEILAGGWDGYQQYTHTELQKAVADLCEDNYDSEKAGTILKERAKLKEELMRLN